MYFYILYIYVSIVRSRKHYLFREYIFSFSNFITTDSYLSLLKFSNFKKLFMLTPSLLLSSTTLFYQNITTDQTTLHSASSATLKMERNTQSRLLSEQKDTTSTLKSKTLDHTPTH